MIILLASACFLQALGQQARTGSIVSFDKFFKDKMQVTPGTFPVYQQDDKYYLQIGPNQLQKDILVVGDMQYGSAVISRSSGILRFVKGQGDNLYVTRNNYSEQVLDQNIMTDVLNNSILEPISYTFKIEAMGKDTGSYVIDITKQLIDGGELFSFKNYNLIANPDPTRSGVESVKPIQNGIYFNVFRSQTSAGRDYNGKQTDVASTFRLGLALQLLSDRPMPVKLNDRRIGFDTRTFTDFGARGYSAKKVSVIKKWNVEVKPEDVARYKAGALVEPKRPINVYLHPSIPAFLMPAVQAGVLEWNKCFETAGFKNVIKVMPQRVGNEPRMEDGSVLIAWAGSNPKAIVDIVDDPRTGEIKTAKMTLSDVVTDALMQKYFVQCGMYDERIQKDPNSLEVRKDILQFKVAQSMATVLGMLPNYAGSAAYSLQQLRDPKFVMQHGFTSSVTDELEFNYLVVPGKQNNKKLFIAAVSSYDHFAIDHAYRQLGTPFKSGTFTKDGKIDPEHYYSAEDKNNPYAQANDLSSQNLEAAQAGIDRLIAFYPKLNGISAKFKDDTWDTYMLLAANFIMMYDEYVMSVMPNIGGKQRFTVMKGYNDMPVKYVPKARQLATFVFLGRNILQKVPAWTRNDHAQSIDGSNTETLLTKTAVKVVNGLVNADLIKTLIDAEASGQKDVFTTNDLFAQIDHYLFLDFDPNIALTSYQRNIQATLIRSLLTLAGRNKIGAGLSEMSITINGVLVPLTEHIGKVAKTHKDKLTREHYQLLKMLIDNEQPNK